MNLYKVVKMCPDTQLISLYLDGELPSPWKEKMESHLAHCSGCSEKLENYKQLHHKLAKEDAELELFAAAKDRVWQNLQSAQTEQPVPQFAPRRLSGGFARRSDFLRQAPGMWRRRLSIPMPAAAAAAVVLAILAALLIRGGVSSQFPEAANARVILAADEALPAIIPAADITDMNGILQYLGSDGNEIIILRLPESSNFISSGEPAILRAADYQRNAAIQRRSR